MNKLIKLLTFVFLAFLGWSVVIPSNLTAATISEKGGKTMDYEKLKIKSYKHWDLYLHENQCYLILIPKETNRTTEGGRAVRQV